MPLIDKRSGDALMPNKVIKNVFIFDAHCQNPLGDVPFAEGKLNAHYVEKYTKYFTEAGCTVTSTHVRDLKTDEDFKNIDFTAEKKKWKQADLVIVQTPVWWFSLPWAAKRYIDEVFTRAMDAKDEWVLCATDGRRSAAPEEGYATGGNCHGKYFLSVTTNAPRGAYNRDVNAGPLKNKSIDDVLLMIHGNMQFINMTKIPDSTFQAYDVVKNNRFDEDQKRLDEHLASMFEKTE